ncbi:Chitin synthase, class 2, partial [Ascosphaera pollenicola]
MSYNRLDLHDDNDEPEMAPFPRSHASPPPVAPYHSSLESDIAYQGATLHSPFAHNDPSGELGYPMEERHPDNAVSHPQRHVHYLTPSYDRLQPQPT